MNFTELYKKIDALDKGIDTQINECACDEMGPEHQPKQQDNVNMNITINGQGSGGIRDLMDILRNIDTSGEPQHHDKPLQGSSDVMVSEPSIEHEPVRIDLGDEQLIPEMEPAVIELEPTEEVMDDSYANSVEGGSNPKKFGIEAVIGMGDDLLSKGSEKPKVNGGGNPGAVSESLVNHLKDLYNEVKKKSLNEGRDLPGYGDEETWGGRYPAGDAPYKKPRYRSEPDDYVDQEPEHKVASKSNIKWETDKEGVSPNGQRYNTRILVKGTSKFDIQKEIYSFEKHHWGAKKLVDVAEKETDDGYIGVLYIVDNHKHGMWKPWKDQEAGKPFTFG